MSLIRKYEFKKLDITGDSKIFPDSDLLGNSLLKGTVTLPKVETECLESDLKWQMKQMTSYFSEFKSLELVTPFKATCLLMTKDKKTIFVAGPEGRLSAIKVKTKEIFYEIDLKSGYQQKIIDKCLGFIKIFCTHF